MTPLTLVQYLFGNRLAILRVARSRGALLVGLMFVVAAGFAREYDGEDLLAEPWHVLIPLGASLATSAALYAVVRIVAALHGEREPRIISGYLDFLGLYWMTAPLALLYAIPFERLLSAPDSVKANLWLLALVALWRVLLMSRVVSVIYSAPWWKAFALVMLFSDTLAIFILFATPLPIVQIMGGIRLSESESALQGVLLSLRALCLLTWPTWAIATGMAIYRGSESWSYFPITGPSTTVSWSLWGFGSIALVVWAFVLPFTQPEQQLRHRVERNLRNGRFREALATMSAHELDDFPRYWDPPPRVAYLERRPDIAQVYQALDPRTDAAWVRQLYGMKYLNVLGDIYSWRELSTEEIALRIAVIENLPDRDEAVRRYYDELEWALYERGADAVELQARLDRLKAQAGIGNE